MPKDKLSVEEKAAELTKYREFLFTTIDYYLENSFMRVKTGEYDYHDHLQLLKSQVEEHFQGGRLSKLKQWFRDMTEPQIEGRDLKFNKYLQDKTKYDINIFDDYFKRIDSIIEKGKITTDNQFYDVNILVDQLCQEQLLNDERIAVLNKLLGDYEQLKSKKKK